jgi:hypothetical protein
MKDEPTTGPGEEGPVEPSTDDVDDREQTRGRPYSGRSAPLSEDEDSEQPGPDDSTRGRPYSGK